MDQENGQVAHAASQAEAARQDVDDSHDLRTNLGFAIDRPESGPQTLLLRA